MVCPSLTTRQFPVGPGVATKIIVDEKGHLLPGVPRNKITAWGLLQYYMKNKKSNMVATETGKSNQKCTSIEKRMKKLPRYIPKKLEGSGVRRDFLLEYLRELRLPIIWIIGPPTKNIFHRRKQFSKQLAASLHFGYVNLDDKIQEWKDRQSTCPCANIALSKPTISSNSSNCGAAAQYLASTSIAPNKLPTSVPPCLSTNLQPSCTSTSAIFPPSNLLDSQRITFDTALPIERNKILELYKFAMAECLPCDGFVLESVPYDLIEGLAFEKTFYPAALAIYFAEGIPQKRQRQPRNAASTTSSLTKASNGQCKKIMNPLEYFGKCKKAATSENVYLRCKTHKRLGAFNVAEGEKICKQFGSKTIRIINAEDVERDTMEFLNELVKKNLEKYQEILDGNAKLDSCIVDFGGRQYFRLPSSKLARGSSPLSTKTNYSYSSSFIPEPEDQEEGEEIVERKTILSPVLVELNATPQLQGPPPVIPVQSDVSSSPLPNIFQTTIDQLRLPSPPLFVQQESAEIEDKTICFEDENTEIYSDLLEKKQSFELLERINKLESKVAALNSPEEDNIFPSHVENEIESCLEDDKRLPPPTAYAEDSEQETLTSVIRRAIERQNMLISQQRSQSRRNKSHSGTEKYDHGASGDHTNVHMAQSENSSGAILKEEQKENHTMHHVPDSDSHNLEPDTAETCLKTKSSDLEEYINTVDPFYDD